MLLIVDDSIEMVKMLSAILRTEGEILFGLNGEAGLRIASERRPALMLLDVNMAGMDGYEVCRRLKADPATAGIAVIFVTADKSETSELRALAAGAVDFVTKPLNPPVALARVRTQLRICRQNRAIAELANRDGLTGLFNRRHFDTVAETEFTRHKCHQLPLGVAFIDIDCFKIYNDRLGHQAGDMCLKLIAQTLAESVKRPGEMVARYGGEEFVVLLPNISSREALAFGELLCEIVCRLDLPHPDSANKMVTISVGVVAAVPCDSDSMVSFIAAADQALFQAKHDGRNRSVFSGHSD
ncbi:GGDEF domain-containing protein [Duganella vulcania]|uniref:diguanylate cyclase n=1 Tax=Duganella vulcania TaxID=2692166 RepID=A0A845GN06_9BURK|nr:diguanylate cyclase [Duganella vulcania]MYM95943.1 diguanylate cyclase [Duganella vulcania]